MRFIFKNAIKQNKYVCINETIVESQYLATAINVNKSI